ncbi:MAG TPA: hypothetical protein VFX37_05295 [Pseudolabrys sp.]|nr:hypothetical protein [Pseudolabrys sp.]
MRFDAAFVCFRKEKERASLTPAAHPSRMFNRRAGMMELWRLMVGPVVRVSVLRCKPEQFQEFKQMMAASLSVLDGGIKKTRGLIHYYAGEDEAVSSLTNVSIWETLADAKQMDTFKPMLDLGVEFARKGATFERPIMNYATLWQLDGTKT